MRTVVAGGGRKIAVVSNGTARLVHTDRLRLHLHAGGIRYRALLLVAVRVRRRHRHHRIFIAGVALTDR